MGPWAHGPMGPYGPGPIRERKNISLFGDLSINGCGHPPSGGKTSSENDPSKKFKRLGAQKCPFSEI